MSPEAIREVLDRIKYEDWWIDMDVNDQGPNGQVVTFCWAFPAPDFSKPERQQGMTVWFARTWDIYADTNESAIVKTAFLALKVALEHEAMEAFSYNGVRVFDPHIDIHRLKTAALGEARERADRDGRIHP